MKQLFVISFLLVCFQTFGQKPYVELILSPEKVEVNETFTVTVKSNIQGDINIDLPEHFVNGNNVMNRMEHEIDQVTGEVTTFMYYSRSGSMKKTGKFSFGPAYVRRGNKVFRSNMTQIHVSEVGSKKEDFAEHNILRKPACGIVVPSKTEVYVGEPLCLEAKVISKFSPTHYESYESYKLKPIAETHELNHNQQVTVRLEGIGRHQRFVFEHDKKLLFPQVAGKLTIESFELMLQSGFDSYPVTSSPIAIRVNPLPPGAPKSFNGAVGDFSIEAKTIKWCGKEGDIIPYEVVLKGTGNIHDVEITKPKLPKGFSYYGDPEVKEKINFTEKGASGEINCLFYIQAHEIGVFESPDFDFSYFDLKSKKYISIQTHSVEWKVLSDPNKQIDGENKKAPLVVESYDSPKNNTANVASTAWMKWIGYSTSAVLAFLLIFGFAKRKSSTNKEVDSSLVSVAKENEPEINKSYFSSNYLNRLQIYFDNENKEKFYSESKKCIREYRNWLVTGKRDKSFELTTLDEKIASGEISEELIESLKLLERSSDNYLYGGIEEDGEGQAFLNKLRIALHL